MPGPQIRPVVSDEDFVDKVDVAIVGGGIVGACTALELAERGVSVAVFERGDIAQEQSSRNLGWVRLTNRDPREIPLMIEALRLWAGMDQRTGQPTGYTRCGIVFADRTENDLERRLGWTRNLDGTGFACAPLTTAEVDAFFPGAHFDGVGGIHSPFDGRAEPQLAAPAIIEAARQRGARIYAHCAVTGIETTAGRVSGVETIRGRVAASSVVIAGGAWSRQLCRSVGVDFPQLDLAATVLRTGPIDGPETSFGTGEYAFRRRLDGGYTVGTFDTRADITPAAFRYAPRFLKAAMSQSVRYSFGPRYFRELMGAGSAYDSEPALDPRPWFDLRAVIDRVAREFPFLRGVSMAQGWGGYLDVTPDELPVIGAVGNVSGLFLSSGYSGHGFGLAPGAGRLAADLVTGTTPIVDPKPFALSRLVPGSDGPGPSAAADAGGLTPTMN